MNTLRKLMPKEFINLNIDDDYLKKDKGLQENSMLKVWLTKANAYQCTEFGSTADLHKKGRKVEFPDEKLNPRRSPRALSTEKGRKRQSEKWMLILKNGKLCPKNKNLELRLHNPVSRLECQL
jgi:hypothetical protein